jgi:AraC-like DNA-binding protein
MMNSESRNRHPPGQAPPQHERPHVEARGPDGAGVPRAQDHWRVNLSEAWEIGFWGREFGCSEGELKRAVHAVGDCAGAVRAYLLQYRNQQRN